MQDDCEMVNLPSLLGRDDSRGAVAQGRCRVRTRTGMVLGLGRSLFSILEDARYQQKYDTFKSVYHPDSENDVELADWNALYLPGSDVT